MFFRSKKAKVFQGLWAVNPHQGSTMNQLQSLDHLGTITCILQQLKTQSEVKKQTLVDTYVYIKIFYLLLGCSKANFRPILGDNLTNLILITAFFKFLLWPKGQQELCNEVRSINPTKYLWGFNWNPTNMIVPP